MNNDNRKVVLVLILLVLCVAGALSAQAPPACSTTKSTSGTTVTTVTTCKYTTPPPVHDTVVKTIVRVDTVLVAAPAPTPAPQPTPTPVPTPIPVPPSTGYATPDLLNNASFETGWDGFTNWSHGSPDAFAGNTVSRDATQAYDGTTSIKRVWAPNPGGDGGSQLVVPFAASDHVWLRFYFKLTAPITSIMKFARFYDASMSQSRGGLFLKQGSEIFSWGWDIENQAVTMSTGLTEAQVIDGKWHSLEVDYWRNGDPSGQPSVAFWFDGTQVTRPDGTSYGVANWRGGRMYAGERKSTLQLGYMEWVGTLNTGNTTSGIVWLDRIAYSTKGRIGP